MIIISLVHDQTVGIRLDIFRTCCQDSGALSCQDLISEPVQDLSVESVAAGDGDGSGEEFGEPPVDLQTYAFESSKETGDCPEDCKSRRYGCYYCYVSIFQVRKGDEYVLSSLSQFAKKPFRKARLRVDVFGPRSILAGTEASPSMIEGGTPDIVFTIELFGGGRGCICEISLSWFSFLRCCLSSCRNPTTNTR